MTRAVFLDRDGVINELVAGPEGPDSPRSVGEFRLLAGVPAAIRALNELGLPVVVVSNQPGIAKGKYPAANLDAITEYMKDSLSEHHAKLQGVYYCTHHPEAIVADYRTTCECRKPKSGLLTAAAREMNLVLAGSYMVGDQPRDMIAGKSVGCTTVLVHSGSDEQITDAADHTCRDLAAAVQLIAEFEAIAMARV